MLKKIMSGVLSFCLLAASGVVMPKGDTELSVQAAYECTSYSGSNVNAQSYKGNWASPIKSYLTECDNGSFMKVQSGAVSGKLIVEYLDSEYQLTESKQVGIGLPIFGGFYASDDGYFILSGQENRKEYDSVEVYRITKYDLDWNEVGSCSLFGANTYIPFRGGTARMTSSDDYLLIRTCHEMYVTEDGLHHQANVTIQIDMDSMEITDSATQISNNAYGYVSHSFNQFIKTDESNIVAVDHGDAHPRSIVLTKYNSDFTWGMFSPITMDVFSMGNYGNCTVVDMLSISGETGANYTGATVGGFEISDSNYIVAGSTVDQSNLNKFKTKNIFISTISRNLSGDPVINYVTNYEEGSESPSNPHLVKISGSEFMLMWTHDGKLYYTMLDEKGEVVGELNSADAELSDCVPIVSGGKLIWYTWADNENAFYELDLSDMGVSKTVVDTGHRFEYEDAESGQYIVTRTCRVCGYSEQLMAPSSMTVWWKEPGATGSYWSVYQNNYKVGQELSVFIKPQYTEDYKVAERVNDIDVTISDTSVIEYVTDSVINFGNYNQVLGRFIMVGAGTATVTIQPRYAPYLKRTYSINVDCGLNIEDIKYQKNISEMVRFIYIADLSEVATAKDGQINISSSKIGDLQKASIRSAYKILYANGKKIVAPEGKCYLISPSICTSGLSDLKAQFVFDDVDKGYNQYRAG